LSGHKSTILDFTTIATEPTAEKPKDVKPKGIQPKKEEVK
jgi:hypothetical protein